MKQILNEKLLDVTEVAKKLELHVTTIRKMITRNELPATKLGKSFYIAESTLKKYLRGEIKAPTIPNDNSEVEAPTGKATEKATAPLRTPKISEEMKIRAQKRKAEEEARRQLRKAEKERKKKERTIKTITEVGNFFGEKITQKISEFEKNPLF